MVAMVPGDLAGRQPVRIKYVCLIVGQGRGMVAMVPAGGLGGLAASEAFTMGASL